MPIHGYPGNVISATPPSVTPAGASGVFTTEQQMQYQTAGNWPMAATQISRSLRFNSADSAYLNRTPASASNRKTWTWSAWVKRGLIDANYRSLFCGYNSGTDLDYILFNNDYTLGLRNYNGTSYDLKTTQVFRDPSAWYHFVVAVDTTQATDTNRVKMYVNGVQITAFTTATYPSQNYNFQVNNNVAQYLGYNGYNYIDGYMTEVNFIDGYALTPASFGQTNSNTGIWEPRQYTGPYGTNGFYLNFSDNSGTTSTTLGKDYSGNGNNWTPNNFSVTAGAGNDSLVDTPTPYGTDTGAGGEVRGNYCTWNPLAGTGSGVTGYGWTLANGNLDYTATDPATYSNTITSTFAVTSGKWYLEVTMGSSPAGGHPIIGVIETEDISLATSTSNFQTATYTSVVRGTDGQKSVFGSTSFASYGSSLASGDRLNIAIDGDNGKIWWGKNGTWFNSGVPASGTNAGDTFTAGRSLSIICTAYNANGTNVLNAGQRPFADTVPSGFKALCTQNLPTPTIGATATTRADDYFNTVLYTGTGSSLGVTGVGFQPDFTWIKGRSGATDHGLYDAVRGVQKQLESNNNGAETTETTGLTAFNTDGFTVGALAQLNTNTATYVAWNWKANGVGSSNTAGSRTSTVSVNSTSGFSIITFNSGSAGNITVGHGLGVIPSMLIMKVRDNTGGWYVWFTGFSASQFLGLDDTGGTGTDSRLWANATPTSTVFSLESGYYPAASKDVVAYAFSAVAGYSAFGSYTGNGSADGPFVYLGFRPRFVMVKQATVSARDWIILDTSRNTYNVADLQLMPNKSDAEAATVLSSTAYLDILSNGFKVRNTSVRNNENTATYIYAAFAESPFKYALAR